MRIAKATALGSLALTAGLAAQEAATDLAADMSYKAAKKWSIILPEETWSEVDGGIKVAHQNGDSFSAYEDGLALALNVDTNGDGKPDKTVKGAKGYLVLKGKDADGNSMSYAVRFKAKGKKYSYASSGMMRGRLNGETIMLIDQNNNGVYNEVGVDAMVVGKAKSAHYLSKIVNLKGDLFELTVSADGKKIEATPFAGESGVLNLKKDFKSKGKLTAAVVKSSDGNSSFNLVGGDLRVPQGSYTLAFGLVEKANETVKIKNGKMAAIEVNPSRTTQVAWGGPLMADFAFTRKGEAVNIQPNALHYYGKAGEEYHDFLPQGASPKFLVYDERKKKLLKSGRFGT